MPLSSVAQSCPTLQPHGLKQPRLPCPSSGPGDCSDSCPLSQWCHPTIPSPVIPSASCLQSFPASGSFLMSQFFTSSGQSVEALASILPVTIEDQHPFQLTGLFSLQSKGLSQESSPTPQFKSISSSVLNFLYGPTLTSIYDSWENHGLTRWTFVGKGMSLLFNMLPRLVIAFLPRSKRLLISWL